MYSNDVLSSPEKVYEYSKLKIGSNKNELLMAVFLNTKNMVIRCEIVSEGSIDSVAVYPRKIMELALKNNASGLIDVVHNNFSAFFHQVSNQRLSNSSYSLYNNFSSL